MKTIKDAYLSFINEEGMEDFETFGGMKIVNNIPTQVPFTKSEVLKRIKFLNKTGCKVTLAEICYYRVDEDDEEIVDPYKREYLV